MSLNEQIDRLYTVKSDLFSAINSKGGNLTVNQSISEYAAAVIALPSGGGEIVFPQVTVTADKLLSGVTATDSDGNVVTGAIPTVTASRNGDIITVPAGFVAQQQTFNVGVTLPEVSVTADKLLKDITAINSDGEVVTGTIETVTLSRNGNTVSIAKGYTEGGSVTVSGGSGGSSKAQLFCATLIFK